MPNLILNRLLMYMMSVANYFGFLYFNQANQSGLIAAIF